MKRLLILAPALLLAVPAIAQGTPEAPAEGYRNLWCHVAFMAMTSQMPPLPADQLEAARAAGGAATPEQQQLLAADAEIQGIIGGAPALLDTARVGYLGAGFTEEQFNAVKTELEPKVAAEISGPPDGAEFTYVECVGLLPAPAPETPVSQ